MLSFLKDFDENIEQPAKVEREGEYEYERLRVNVF